MRTYTSHKPAAAFRFGVEQTRRGIYTVYAVHGGADVAQRIGMVERITPWRWRPVGTRREYRTMLQAQIALMEAND